jgi:hypothetical protein
MGIGPGAPAANSPPPRNGSPFLPLPFAVWSWHRYQDESDKCPNLWREVVVTRPWIRCSVEESV